jgi:uncharacterized protein (TIGR02118 family)
MPGDRLARVGRMIRVSVLYPAGDDIQFDHDYYRDSHVPLVSEVWKPVKAEIDKGVNGPYVAGVHFFFESLEQMQAAMGLPGTADVMADVANYTSIQPVMQISEVV